MDEVPDHKVGIYCNVIGPLAALRHMHFRAKYLRTFLHENACDAMRLTGQSRYSICLLYGQVLHPYSIY